MKYRITMLVLFTALFGAVLASGWGFSSADAAQEPACEDTAAFCSADLSTVPGVAEGCPYMQKSKKADGECPFKKARAAQGENEDDDNEKDAVECPHMAKCGKDCNCKKNAE